MILLLCHRSRGRRQKFKGAASLFDAAVAQALAQFEGGGEALARELVFAEPKVSDAAEVEAVGLSPGVLAVGRFRAVERVAGVLKVLGGLGVGAAQLISLGTDS
jgi:hypothetical protein